MVEGEDGLLSTIGLGASMIGLALVGAYTSIFVSLAGDVARVAPPNVTYAIFRAAYTIDSCSDLGFGVAMIAFSLVIARTRALAPWTGWFGILGGFVFALGALSIAGPKSGPFKLAEVLGTLLFAVWIVGTSISMWRSSVDTPEPSA